MLFRRRFSRHIASMLLLATSTFVEGISFQDAVSYPAGPDNMGLATADFNRDGKLDLAVASAGFDSVASCVSVLLGNGDGSFQLPLRFAFGYHPTGVVAADFNQDGNSDIAFIRRQSYGMTLL